MLNSAIIRLMTVSVLIGRGRSQLLLILHTIQLYQTKNIIKSSFKSSGDIQRKRVGQTAVSDNQSSSVALYELAKKARKKYTVISNFSEEVIK